MTLYYRVDEKFITMFGQTFPHKNRIKALGGEFLYERKLWRLPLNDESIQSVKELCQSAGGGDLVGGQAGAQDSKLPPPSSRAQSRDLLVPRGSLDCARDDEERTALGMTKVTIAGENPAPKKVTYTVRNLVDKAHDILTQSFSLPLWVVGEITDVKENQGHFYFSIADTDPQPSSSNSGKNHISVSAVIWRDRAKSIENEHKIALRDVIQNGLKVCLLIQVGFYKNRAQMTLSVMNCDVGYTIGNLALEREKLMKELKSLGLDVANKKRPLTKFPFRVGLVCAQGSMAQGDFLHQLEVSPFPGEVFFAPASVQGEMALKEIPQALKLLAEKGCDVIVLTRGGGSQADLRWFDHRTIAFAIAECPVPVVSAIGHHDDTCIAEAISYLRAKTPTAAADQIVECFVGVTERLKVIVRLFSTELQKKSHTAFQRAQNLQQALHFYALSSLEKRRQVLTHFWSQILQSSQTKLHRDEMLLAKNYQVLTSLDVTTWLQKGWTRIEGDDLRPLGQARDVKVGSRLRARLPDGILHLVVESVEAIHQEL